ncbi:hypothetical protein GFK79_24030 [Escherichia coli]|nr:hypothetical protein [Escherichia coli]
MIVKRELPKNYIPTKKAFYIGLFMFIYIIAMENYFYRKKHLENIILSSFGVIYLVHIHSRENRIYLQLTED